MLDADAGEVALRRLHALRSDGEDCVLRMKVSRCAPGEISLAAMRRLGAAGDSSPAYNP